MSFRHSVYRLTNRFLAPQRNSIGRALVKSVGNPTLDEMSRLATVWTLDPYTAMRALTPAGVSGIAEDQLRNEHAQVASRIQQRAASVQLEYPSSYQVADGTTALLYGLVRSLRPRTVVETGVADGRSSAFILAALEANDHGQLVSIDISDNVGVLASGSDRWQLQVVGQRNKKMLANILKHAAPIDLFVHDSSHTYFDLWLELETAHAFAAPGAVMLADDADWSYALFEFSRSKGAQLVLLVDERKVFGGFFRPGA